MSEVKWKHKVFEADDRDRVLDLRKNVFGEEAYDIKRWSWQYRDNPMGESYIDLAVDKLSESVLAGHYAVISYQLILDGKEMVGAQSLDTFTSSDYRRQGIFVELAEKTYHRAHDSNVELIFGFPNANSYPGFVKKLNFIDPFGFGIYKLPLRLGYYSNRLLGNNFLSSIPLKLKFETSMQAKKVKSVEKDMDLVGEAFSKKVKYMVKRDQNYFKWRYFDCPDRDYEIYKIDQGSKKAYFVFATDFKTNFTHLVDLIFTNEIDLNEVVNVIINLCLDKKISCLTCYLNEENILGQYLEKNGFNFTDQSSELRFIIRDLGESLSAEVKKSSNWYITAGDTDFY